MQQFSFEPKILLQKLKYNSTTGMSKFEKYPFLEFLGCFLFIFLTFPCLCQLNFSSSILLFKS